MDDASRLIQEPINVPASAMANADAKNDQDYFLIDEEQPLKIDDSKTNKILGIVGKALRKYEIGKLVIMGYTEAQIYALLD